MRAARTARSVYRSARQRRSHRDGKACNGRYADFKFERKSSKFKENLRLTPRQTAPQIKLSKTDAARVKFAMIFTHSKDVWRIYIYDINGEKNG